MQLPALDEPQRERLFWLDQEKDLADIHMRLRGHLRQAKAFDHQEIVEYIERALVAVGGASCAAAVAVASG